MMSPEPEHVCPVKCDGNGNKCPGLDTGQLPVIRGDTDSVCTNCWSPPVTYDQHSHHRHTTPVQEVNQSSSTPWHLSPDIAQVSHLSPRWCLPPPLRLAYASLTGSSETEDKTQSYDSQHPAHLLSPAFSMGQYSTVSFFLLFYCIWFNYDGYIFFFLSVHYFII